MVGKQGSSRRSRRSRAKGTGSEFLRADRFGPLARARLSGPGLRTFLNIADRWDLSQTERRLILGSPVRSTCLDWVSKAREGRDLTLSLDVLLRISAVLGVHKGLKMMVGPDAEEQRTWLRAPHDAPTFGGKPPIALLANGTLDGIMRVRRHLDALGGSMFAAPVATEEEPARYADDDILLS